MPTCSCKKTSNWTSEIISDETIQYHTPQSSLPMWGFKRRGSHHPCYLPIYFTGSMQVRKKKKMFSCPLYPVFNLKKSLHAQSPSNPSFISKTKQNKTKIWPAAHFASAPPYWGDLEKEKVLIQTDTTKFINTAGLQAPCVCSSLSPLDIFDVGSLRQAGVVGTLAGITLTRGTCRSRLTVGTGVSWLSLGSGLSRASVFTVTRQTSWTCCGRRNNLRLKDGWDEAYGNTYSKSETVFYLLGQ